MADEDEQATTLVKRMKQQLPVVLAFAVLALVGLARYFKDAMIMIESHLSLVVWFFSIVALIYLPLATRASWWSIRAWIGDWKRRALSKRNKIQSHKLWDTHGNGFIEMDGVIYEYGKREEFSLKNPTIRFPKCSNDDPKCRTDVMVEHYPNYGYGCHYCGKVYCEGTPTAAIDARAQEKLKKICARFEIKET